MGFFDDFKDEGGFNWVSSDEKKVLIKEEVRLPIYRVLLVSDRFFDADNIGYNPGPELLGKQFVVITELDGEERAIGFKTGSVQSRDRMLVAMQDYLADDEGAETPVVVIRKIGQSQVLVNPDAE